MFEQRPNDHLKGQGCPTCAKQPVTTLEFIEKSNFIHRNTYDYSKSNYTANSKNIVIICSSHGEFNQRAGSHLEGKGCPICSSSKGELLIRKYLDETNIKYVLQKRFKNCKNKKPLPFDFYLPDHNTCIEFQGKQHFESVDYFGGITHFEYVKLNDKIKREFCISNNITLIEISYLDASLTKLRYFIPALLLG